MSAALIDLGCQNGWKENPPAYEKHLAECGEERYLNGKLLSFKAYPETETKIGHCLTRMTCPKCGITYTADSSD